MTTFAYGTIQFEGLRRGLCRNKSQKTNAVGETMCSGDDDGFFCGDYTKISIITSESSEHNPHHNGVGFTAK